MPLQTLTIADGDQGTDQTVSVMARLIREGGLQPNVRAVAISVVAGMPVQDGIGQLQALRDWLAPRFRFIADPSSGELLHDAGHLLRQIVAQGEAYGDCDDAAILAGALACSVGFRVGLITVALGPGPGRDAPFSHVWASATPHAVCRDQHGRQVWIEFDVTRPMQAIPIARITRAKSYVVC